MMPVVRISDATYAHLQRHAKPFEDSPDSVIIRALTALDMVSAETAPPVWPEQVKRGDSPKLPQKEFRLPLLMALLKSEGSAPAKTIRNMMESLMAPKLTEGDYESVSTGDPRWWNAICWERSELVKERLMRADSDRGVWELSETGKSLPATFHRRRAGGGDRVILQGTLAEVAREYWSKPSLSRHFYFVMVEESVFQNSQEESSLGPRLLMKVDDLQISVRSANCFKNEGIVFVGEMIQKSEAEWLRTPNFGRKSLVEIKEVLAQMGLALGMQVPEWPPANLEELRQE